MSPDVTGGSGGSWIDPLAASHHAAFALALSLLEKSHYMEGGPARLEGEQGQHLSGGEPGFCSAGPKAAQTGCWVRGRRDTRRNRVR